MSKPLVMSPGFFIGSLVVVFIVALFGSMFLSLTAIFFAVVIPSFGERLKALSKKIEECGDEEIGWD